MNQLTVETHKNVSIAMLETMPNTRQNVPTIQQHILAIPRCCPVSKNPQEGSTLKIIYKPQEKHIEVYSLKKYLESFVGGQKCPYSGAIAIRNMEEMIQEIAIECAKTAGVKVTVIADLILDCGQLKLICKSGKND